MDETCKRPKHPFRITTWYIAEAIKVVRETDAPEINAHAREECAQDDVGARAARHDDGAGLQNNGRDGATAGKERSDLGHGLQVGEQKLELLFKDLAAFFLLAVLQDVDVGLDHPAQDGPAVGCCGCWRLTGALRLRRGALAAQEREQNGLNFCVGDSVLLSCLFSFFGLAAAEVAALRAA
jgi:hypothetical protein